jgi:DNA-binding MarR family transcriptional regulator
MKKAKQSMINQSAGFPAVLFAVVRRLREEAKESVRNIPTRDLPGTFGSFAVLHYVDERGKPSMHDIAENLFISPPAASLLVDGMVRDKLLGRTADSRDRRTIRVTLTARGRQYLKKGQHQKIEILRKVFSVLSEREQLQLIVLLKKVVAADFKKKKEK